MNYLIGFLIQLIFYSILWFWDEYVALMIGLIMGFVITGILILAYIVELIEKSKVPKSYYRWMLISSIAPILVTLFFSFIYKGQFDWLNTF